jgi:hypothetical protein
MKEIIKIELKCLYLLRTITEEYEFIHQNFLIKDPKFLDHIYETKILGVQSGDLIINFHCIKTIEMMKIIWCSHLRPDLIYLNNFTKNCYRHIIDACQK